MKTIDKIRHNLKLIAKIQIDSAKSMGKLWEEILILVKQLEKEVKNG